MANYKLVFKKSVARDLRALPKTHVARILARVRTLAEEPRGPGCEKLSGQDRYRVRQGQYLILYEIHDTEVLVLIVKIVHRSRAYR